MTVWTFRYHQGKWTRLANRWFDRLFKAEVTVEGADTEALLTATVVVELEDRAPLRLGPPRFDRRPLRPDGTLDVEATQRAAPDAVDLVLGPIMTPLDSNVIDAESKFNNRRHQREQHWTPTHDQLMLLVAALERAGTTPAVARRLLDRP